MIAEKTKLEEEIVELKAEIQTLETSLEETNIKLKRAQETQFDNLTVKEMFRIAADTYSVDYSLLYAIGRLESGNFTSDLYINKNNVGGMRYDGEWLSYLSKQEGIMELARLIRKNYIDQGLTTPEAIGRKYCPDTAEDWAKKIKTIMAEEN